MSYAYRIGKTIIDLASMSKNRDYLKRMRRTIDLYIQENNKYTVHYPMNKESFLGELLLDISENIPITLNFKLKRNYFIKMLDKLHLPDFIDKSKLSSDKIDFFVIMKIESRKFDMKIIIKGNSISIRLDQPFEDGEIHKLACKKNVKESPINTIINHAISRFSSILIN